MKISKTVITVILAVGIGVAILAMQNPVTNAITGKQTTPDFKITNVWDLPSELNEISSIAWLKDDTFACVQDEDGIIYIYDLDQNKILERIKFAGPGDYEGVAIHDMDAYVMRSDGLIFEIQNYRSKDMAVTEFQTVFSEKNNIESLFFDSKNNRLLTAAKDKDINDDAFKGIYEIPLSNKTMNNVPVAEIDLNEKALETFRHKKIEKTFSPSEITINPKTNDFYILEGKNPKFIILDENGKFVSVTPLDKKTFPQPEGITFSSDGRLFISNEGGNGTATIIEIKLN